MQSLVCDAKGYEISCESNTYIVRRVFLDDPVKRDREAVLYLCKKHNTYFTSFHKSNWFLFLKTKFHTSVIEEKEVGNATFKKT